VADKKIPVPEDKRVNPSAEMDAARMYISAMCDVDDQFNLPEGKTGKPQGKSAAVLKADHTRIVGREGLKLVTGVDKFNSKHKPVISVPPIELIAGNVRPDQLEPIPKGHKLVAALNSIVDRMNQIQSALQNFLQFQMELNCHVMAHVHPSPTGIAISTLAGAGPKGFCNGETLPHYKTFMAGYKALTAGLMCQKDMMMYRHAAEGERTAALKMFSSDYINSRHVFVS
jgi:hypothetical protein